MGIEGEALFYKNKKRLETLVESVSIPPGGVEVIDNGGAIVALGVVDIDDTKGTIRVKNHNKIQGRLIEAYGDEEGDEVDLAGEVVIREGQTLALLKRTKRGLRETVLTFEAGAGEDDYSPNLKDKTPVML